MRINIHSIPLKEIKIGGMNFSNVRDNRNFFCGDVSALNVVGVGLAHSDYMISLRETEILTDPCYCICCYDVEAAVVDLTPGLYTIELCWLEFGDPPEETCYQAEVVIP